MDLNNFISFGKRTKFLFLTILISIICLTKTQLTKNEISSIEKNLLEQQDETTGLFNKSFSSSLKTLKILKILQTKTKNTQKICRELSYETANEINLDILQLNNLLDCKHKFTNFEAYRPENFEKMNFRNFYEAVMINIEIKSELNWENVFENLINFQDEYLFFRNNKDDKDDPSNLTYTVKAFKILVHMANLPKITPSFKGKVQGRIDAIWESLMKEFQVLRDVNLFKLIYFFFRMLDIYLMILHNL